MYFGYTGKRQMHFCCFIGVDGRKCLLFRDKVPTLIAGYPTTKTSAIFLPSDTFFCNCYKIFTKKREANLKRKECCMKKQY